MEKLFKQLIEQMNSRFDKLDDDIQLLGEEVSEIQKEVLGTNKEISNIRSEITDIKTDVNDMKTEVKDIKTDVSDIKEVVTNHAIENISHFKYIERKLDEQNNLFTVVESELKKVKIDIEYLSSKTGKHDVEIYNLNQRIQS